MVIACVALFLATTGTSVAVVNALPKGSVGTKQLKKNAVISSKVKNRSLKAVDFAKGQLPAGAKSVVKRTATGDFGNSFSKVTAHCKSGEVATGGGADWDSSASDGWPVVSYSVPDPINTAKATGWAVEIDNISGSGGVRAIAWVFCAR